MRKRLSHQKAAAFKALFAEGNEARKDGDFERAEASYLRAWSEIPEPRHEYEMYSQIYSRSMVQFYVESEQYGKAREWMKFVWQAYEPLSDSAIASLTFLEATVDYDSGDTEAAFEKFERLCKDFKMRPFKGKDPRYEKFFRTQCDQRRRSKR